MLICQSVNVHMDPKLKINYILIECNWTPKTHKSSDCSYICVSCVCLQKKGLRLTRRLILQNWGVRGVSPKKLSEQS